MRIHVKNIHLDNTNYDDIWLGIFKLEKCNTLKKKISEELMPIVLDTKRW